VRVKFILLTVRGWKLESGTGRGLNNENLKRKLPEECVSVYTTVRNEGDVFVARLWCHIAVGMQDGSCVTLCCVSRLCEIA